MVWCMLHTIRMGLVSEAKFPPMPMRDHRKPTLFLGTLLYKIFASEGQPKPCTSPIQLQMSRKKASWVLSGSEVVWWPGGRSVTRAQRAEQSSKPREKRTLDGKASIQAKRGG